MKKEESTITANSHLKIWRWIKSPVISVASVAEVFGKLCWVQQKKVKLR